MSIQKRTTLVWTLIAIIQMASSASIDQSPSPSSSSSSGLFAADLIKQIAKSKPTENVVFSPISIQTAFAMAYLGAAGSTAEELKNGLRLSSSDKDQIGENFAEILNKDAGEAKLNIANRIFVNSNYQLQGDFNKRSKSYFNSGAEALNFNEKPSEAIDAINNWVEDNTNNKIKNLLQPGSVDADTAALIVNAIYFKGKWQDPFSADMTRKSPFWISKNQSVDVDTMFGSDRHMQYGVFPELDDATAIEMPYQDSDISMMLILPSQKDGLADLEEKLSSVSIHELSSKMKVEKVDLMIPKFKIEFSTGLSGYLKAMGIRSIFEKAELPGIFQSGPPVRVSEAKHKALIDVNEAGSEAAAASFLEIQLMSLDYNLKRFSVDRPFFFAIKDSKAVYFVGHVAKL